jgi:hypothetical protein
MVTVVVLVAVALRWPVLVMSAVVGVALLLEVAAVAAPRKRAASRGFRAVPASACSQPAVEPNPASGSPTDYFSFVEEIRLIGEPMLSSYTTGSV